MSAENGIDPGAAPSGSGCAECEAAARGVSADRLVFARIVPHLTPNAQLVVIGQRDGTRAACGGAAGSPMRPQRGGS